MTMPAAEKNPNIIIIDARAAGYDGEPVRVLGVTLSNSGLINIRRIADWSEQPKPRDDTMVVTDTPAIFKHWGLSFSERDNMQAVMAAYKAAVSAKTLKIDDSLRHYEPSNVIQTRKVDERGRALEFDSMGMNNGHIAILLAVWAARMAHGGYIITLPDDMVDDDDDFDGGILPFSV